MSQTVSAAFDFSAVLRPGDVVAWPQGPGEPLGLTAALFDQAPRLPRFSLFVGMTTSRTLTPDRVGNISILALNGAGSNRRLAAAGRLDILPTHVSAVPRLLRARSIPADVVLIRARPAGRGRFSLGVIADYAGALLASARYVVAEIDERLPLTADDAVVSEADIDCQVSVGGADQIELPDSAARAAEVAIAKRVAALIPDRATVQIGIGGLPCAVLAALRGHRDLGIHSGVIPDVVVDLIEAGVVTNAYSHHERGRSVTGGLFGTRRLFAHADGNRAIAMRSADFTHASATLAATHKLHAVNSAIEIDLGGQVNAEVAGGRYLGAVGGQVDFVRGAQLSEGGRSIIALPSTTEDGMRSKIVTALSGPVTTPRSDADLVVTEFGVADLRGQSLPERARRLIDVAHPDFREALAAGARALATAA